MIKKILFLNSFMLFPQNKNPLSIRFMLYLVHKILEIQDQNLIHNLIQEKVLLVKPSDFAEFYDQDQENVRISLTKNLNIFMDLSFLNDGAESKCFDTIRVLRFKGYLVHLSESFINEVINNSRNVNLINTFNFGKLDSVYSQTLYGQLINSKDNALILSMEFIRTTFKLDGLYINNSYNLSKKCVADPLKKINKVFNTDYEFEKIKINNEVLWIVAPKGEINSMKNMF